MSLSDKENHDSDTNPDIVKGTTAKKNNDYFQNFSEEKSLKGNNVISSTTKQTMSLIDSLKNSPKILSPNEEFLKTFDGNLNKFDPKYSMDIMQELGANNLSFLGINTSAERQLNYSRATISYRQSINVDNLINICSKKLEIEPTHKKALFIRASSYMKKGLYHEAIKDCHNLLGIDSQNVGAYYIRGCAHEKLGEIDKGIDDFTVVLQLDPNHVNAAFARGACQNRKGDFAKAIDDYNMALEKDGEKAQIKKLAMLRRSSSKVERNDFMTGLATPSGLENTITKDDGPNMSEKKVSSFQLSKTPLVEKDQELFMAMMNRGEEDLLNPIEQNNNFLHVDNSQIIGNDHLRTSLNSFNGTTSTTRSAFKPVATDDTISCSSEVSYQDGHSSFKQSKKMEQSELNQMLKTPSEITNPKAKAEWYHSQGFEARKKGEFHLAIEYYTKALEIIPNHFKALFNRGFAYDKIGSYDAAIEDYTQAIKLDPKNAYAYYNRGISLDRKNGFDDAIKNFTIAISLEPNKADFHHNRGFAYRKKKNFHQAIIDYTAAIEIDPKHFKAYYNRAFCHDKLSSLQQAEQDYLQALKLQPKNINALHHLGTLMDKIGGDKLYKALDYFHQALSLDPMYSASYNGRGLVFDKLSKHEEAFKDFSKAMELDAQNPVFIHNRACCLRNMGKLKEALEDFNRALDLDDKNPIIYSNIGLVYRKLEDFENAIGNYTKELYFSKESQKTYNNRAYCYAKLSKYKEAVADYTKALSLDPKNLHALHNRGICYERLGLFRNAIEDFTTVISLNKNNANAYFNRGCCYDSIGELDLAIADYSLALEIDSKNSQNPSAKDKFDKMIL
jgi:tetratricopeptide (TPR) repeat protein